MMWSSTPRFHWPPDDGTIVLKLGHMKMLVKPS